MTFNIRNLILPSDYIIIAELISITNNETMDWKSIQEEDKQIPIENNVTYDEEGKLTGFCRERIVITDDSDCIVGYAVVWHAAWGVPGVMCSSFFVRPSYQEEVWIPLLRYVISWSREMKASILRTELKDYLTHVKALMEEVNFSLERHLLYSKLNLVDFVGLSYPDQIGKLEQKGFVFNTFADMQNDNVEEQIYELWKQTYMEIPGSREAFKSFEQWHKWDLQGGNSKHDLLILAWYNKQLIGLTQILYDNPTEGGMMNEYTGVRKDFRGRGVGLALKLKSIESVLHYKAKYMETGNDSRNIPMIKINNKLGYEKIPGDYIMSLDL